MAATQGAIAIERALDGRGRRYIREFANIKPTRGLAV